MVDPLLFALAVPVLAAILLAFLQSDRPRRWTEAGSAVAVALVVLLAPLFTDLPVQGDEVLIALLVCAGALADAELGGAGAAMRQVRFAGLLIALLPVHPLLVWLGLAIAGSASAAIRWPRRRAVLRRAMAVNVALGLTLFGVAAVQGGSIPAGAAAVLLGWGALVLLEPALLPVVLLLALRMQDLLAGGVFGTAMMAGGTAALVAAAGVHLIGPRRTPAVLTLAQGAIAVLACGLGGAELRFAGLLHLTVLTLCDGALRLSSGTGLDRAASLVSLSGLPPFGVFPSLALILFGVAIRMPWLLVPIMAALLAIGGATAARLPAAGPLRPSPAWVPLALALLLGIAMPAPLAAWFQALAKAAP